MFSKQLDSAIESIWIELEDVPFAESENGELVLENAFLHFPAGTTREDVWHWFDQCHSKGVAFLLYGESSGPNTRVNYLYRDGSNYKVRNTVVLSGRITDQEIAEIKSLCWDRVDLNFIPSQVGLPEERFSSLTEDDSAWFELFEDDSFEHTYDSPTEEMTIQELLANFRSVNGDWKPDDFFNPDRSEFF